jgi:hypothetical protein
MNKLILIFNVFLTDKPRYEGLSFQTPIDRYLDDVRSSPSVYKKRTKVEICAYTLASLAEIAWDHAIVNIGTGDGFTEQQLERLLDYARFLFPNAEISGTRASTRKEYIELFERVKGVFPEGYVFYCPNHDHVFMGTDAGILHRAVAHADDIRRATRSVTRVCYSHQLENILALRERSPIRGMHLLGGKILEDGADYLVAQRDRLAWDSYYISHINDLLSYYYLSAEDGYCPRGEDCHPHPFPGFRNIVVIPKATVCHHYDGYYHTFGHQVFSLFGDKFARRVAPLFIPDGFFEGDIRIRLGFQTTADKWVTINPEANEYSAHNPVTGADMKIRIQNVPLFWRRRISRVSVSLAGYSWDNYSHRKAQVEDANPFIDFNTPEVPLSDFGLDPYSEFVYVPKGTYQYSNHASVRKIYFRLKSQAKRWIRKS